MNDHPKHNLRLRQTVIVAVNAEENPCQMECAYNGPTVELLTGEKTDLHGTVELPGQPHLPHGGQPPRGRVLERPAAAR